MNNNFIRRIIPRSILNDFKNDSPSYPSFPLKSRCIYIYIGLHSLLSMMERAHKSSHDDRT